MRAQTVIALAAILLAPLSAHAADLRIISPSVIYDAGLIELAAKYNETSRDKAVVVRATRSKIIGEIKAAEPPADVIGLPADMMNSLYLEGAVVPGSYALLGRGELGLAVRKGAAKPDIATVSALAKVLKGASKVIVNDPKGGMAQAVLTNDILRRPEFVGVTPQAASGGDAVAALARGEGDLAIQLVQDILEAPGLELVGPLPAELGGHMDTALAVSARSANKPAAAALVRFLTSPAARATWIAKGVRPF
jgi:molybdate transport system substrate-binding protein